MSRKVKILFALSIALNILLVVILSLAYFTFVI